MKKREAYRPFAPPVLRECLAEFFDVPQGCDDLPLMTFVVPVRPDKRDLLAAVTHVDGTARVQSVSRDQNERYWTLIAAFHRLTGVGVVLNTSLNDNTEPIVDSADDAIVTYMTTAIDAMVMAFDRNRSATNSRTCRRMKYASEIGTQPAAA